MNTFIQWQETISDTYLTYTPPCFPFIEPNVSPLPQGSLASIASNALIVKGAQNPQFSFRIFPRDFLDFENSYLWNGN